MNVLVNTTVLSNFAAVGRLDLLRSLFGLLHMAQAVFEEVQAGLDEGYTFYAGLESEIHPFCEDGWLHLTMIEGEEELQLFQRLPPKLHRGEAMSLAIAKSRGWRFLTDDRAARSKADELGISKAGTLAVLVQSIDQSLITLEQGNTILQEMIEHRYQSPVTDLSDLGH
jgi:predicted nucleic acid-binding protein